jgi:hypothetical protein
MSSYAALGKARRNIIKREKKTNVVTGALSAIGTVAAFAAGQANKADTAWKEYEAGHKALGGEGFERPKFGQKGFFKGPEGELQIGKGRKYQSYDKEQVRKAGSFLSSDAAAVLDQSARDQYLERTVPGSEKTRHHDPTKSYPEFTIQQPSVVEDVDPRGGQKLINQKKRMRVADSGNISDFNVQQPIDTSDEFGKSIGHSTEPDYAKIREKASLSLRPEMPFKEDEYDVDEEFGYDAWTAESSVDPGFSDVSRSPVYKPYTPSRQHAMPGPNVNIDFKSQIKQGLKNVFSSGGFTGEGGGTGVKTGVSQIPEDPYSYQNMLNAGTAQDPYTDEQRQPYIDNPENSWFDSWKKNLSKQVKEGTDSTTWYNEDGR